jgi:hypothetical protein
MYYCPQELHRKSLHFKRKSLHINHVSSLHITTRHITSLIHLYSVSISLFGLLDSKDDYTAILPDVGTSNHQSTWPDFPADPSLQQHRCVQRFQLRNSRCFDTEGSEQGKDVTYSKNPFYVTESSQKGSFVFYSNV